MFGALKRMFRPADLPEAAPKGWDALGIHPRYKVVEFPTLEELDAEVVRRGLGASRQFNARKARGAVDPNTYEVLLPAEGLLPPEVYREVRRHEAVHTWGVVHDKNGHKWLTRDGRPVAPLSPHRAALMRSMAEAEARQVRPTMTAPTQTAQGPRPMTGGR